MPLLDLRTDLKSLKYGSDRLGGGDSGLPYIQIDINNPNIVARRGDDGFVRGGFEGAVKASVLDFTRIKKFLEDKPQGFLFRTKQAGLQLSNPRLDIPKNPANIIAGLPDNILARATNGLLEPTRIYNPILFANSTLLQVPANAFGGHFTRHGSLPLFNVNPATKYEAVVTANNNNILYISNPSKDNRLISLTDKFKLGDRTLNSSFARRVSGLFNAVNSVFGNVPVISTILNSLKPKDLIIDKYLAGPGSVYGIGETLINRYSFTEDKDKIVNSLTNSTIFAGKTRNNSNDPVSVKYQNAIGTPIPNSSTGNRSISEYLDLADSLEVYDSNEIDRTNNTSVQNTVNYKESIGSIGTYGKLREQIKQQQELKNPNKESGSIWYNQFGIYNSNSTGSKGSYSTDDINKIGYKNSYGETVTINKSNWNLASRAVRVGSGRKDSINLTPLFKAGIGTDSSVVKIGTGTYTINDLAKFRIEAIDGDNPSQSVFMVFRAYITDLSDDVSAEWDDITYAGRGEKFFIYKGFTRTINISFKVAALSAQEMEPMYQKLNNLMGNLMPDYSPGNTGFPGTTTGVMRGPLVRMTVGNWIDSQPGILRSLSYKVPQDSPWEIALNEPTPGGSKEMILPHIVDVNLSFTPIGSQTQNINKTPNKAGDTQHTSHIAQNYNGINPGEPNYITGSKIETAEFPKGEPSTTY